MERLDSRPRNKAKENKRNQNNNKKKTKLQIKFPTKRHNFQRPSTKSQAKHVTCLPKRRPKKEMTPHPQSGFMVSTEEHRQSTIERKDQYIILSFSHYRVHDKLEPAVAGRTTSYHTCCCFVFSFETKLLEKVI
jgi:hypothetical protein